MRPPIVAIALCLILLLGFGFGLSWFEHHRAELVRRIRSAWEAMLRRYPRLGAFLKARFARGEYLGLHLTIGLVISVLALWLFAAITEDVLSADPLTRFDVALLEWLHVHATPTGQALFLQISRLGSPAAMSALALAGIVLLAAENEWITLTGWVAAFAGASLLDQALKIVIHRPRPPYAAGLHYTSWSFPSGHAMGALVGYGMLAYVSITLWRFSQRVAIIVAAALLIMAIGLSRLYLGVHFFSDVVGGYAAGILWLSTCISGVEVARGWRTSPAPQP